MNQCNPNTWPAAEIVTISCDIVKLLHSRDILGDRGAGAAPKLELVSAGIMCRKPVPLLCK